MERRSSCNLRRVLLALLLAAMCLARAADAAPPASERAKECLIDINDKSVFPDPQPLLLLPKATDAKGFWEPIPKTGLLTLQTGATIHLACPGNGNGNVIKALGAQEATATCVSGEDFKIGKVTYRLYDLMCKTLPLSVQLELPTSTTCGGTVGKFTVVQVGFQLAKSFVKLYDVCFDKKTAKTLYVKSTMVAGIVGYQSGFPRPPYFKQGGLFGNLNVDWLYSKRTQNTTMINLLGSKQQVDMFFDFRDSVGEFFSRGHLSAKVDWVFGSQQNSTFWFLNAAPQWQVFNDGNWANVEDSVFYYAQEKGVDLTLYTGTHEIAELPNKQGVLTKLYLAAKNQPFKIPVPKYIWKLMIDEKNNAGVAIISVNDPTVTTLTPKYRLCTDKCSQLSSWFQIGSYTEGVIYCCDVSEFQSVVKVLPTINVGKLPKL